MDYDDDFKRRMERLQAISEGEGPINSIDESTSINEPQSINEEFNNPNRPPDNFDKVKPPNLNWENKTSVGYSTDYGYDQQKIRLIFEESSARFLPKVQVYASAAIFVYMSAFYLLTQYQKEWGVTEESPLLLGFMIGYTLLIILIVATWVLCFYRRIYHRLWTRLYFWIWYIEPNLARKFRKGLSLRQKFGKFMNDLVKKLKPKPKPIQPDKPKFDIPDIEEKPKGFFKRIISKLKWKKKI